MAKSASFSKYVEHMNAKDYINQLLVGGRYHFTTEEAFSALNGSAVAANSALNRLRKKGEVAMPYRGFNVILPPEHRRIGCLPPYEFVPQLMEHLSAPYYIGLLSAAEKHGAAHYRPQVFQVVTDINRKPLSCGKIKVDFIARKNIEFIPTEIFNTRTGIAKVSTKESTSFDLVGSPQHCVDLGNVAVVLEELGEELNPDALVAIAELSPLSCSQRLGYLLDLVGHEEKTQLLAQYVAKRARHYVPLSLENPRVKDKQSKRWKVDLNISLEDYL